MSKEISNFLPALKHVGTDTEEALHWIIEIGFFLGKIKVYKYK